MKTLYVNTEVNTGYTIRYAQYEGREHIVVPVVMMLEGVHSGSHGPVLHTEEELSSMPQAWNGVPITIQHPQNAQGEHISANSPEVLDSTTVGRVFHSVYNNGLRAEAWLDVNKLRQLSATAYDHIINQLPLDVSVGMFSDTIAEQGDWHDEHYEAIATNYRPDHLALLPDGTGACSWNDGCGIRVNKKGGSNVEEVIVKIKKLDSEEIDVNLQVNEVGFREISQNLQSLLDGMDNNMKTHYLQEVYDNHVIYEVRQNGAGSLYKQTYSVNDTGEVELTGNAAQVRKQVSYIAMEETPVVNKLVRTKFNNNQKQKEVITMAKEETPCLGCMEKVIAIINNEATNFTAENREWLLTLDETILDKLMPKVVEVNESTVAPTKEQAVEVLRETLKKPEDFINVLPEEMRDQMRAGLTLHKEKRQEYIDAILANSEEGIWTQEELNAESTERLSKLAKYIPQPVNYALVPGGSEVNVNGEDADDILPLTGVKFYEKK